MKNEHGFLGGLLDLSFTEFVTIRIIKVLFVIAIILAALGTLAFFWDSASKGVVGAIGGLVFSPLLFLLWVLGARVWLELIVVAFRIAENTSILVEHARGGDTTRSESDPAS